MNILRDFLCSFGLHDKATILASTPTEGLTATASSPDGKIVISTDKGSLKGWYCTNCHHVNVAITQDIQ